MTGSKNLLEDELTELTRTIAVMEVVKHTGTTRRRWDAVQQLLSLRGRRDRVLRELQIR